MKKDTWKKLGMDLATIPNGAPTYIYQHPLRDPGGSVVGYTDGTQCLICYKAVVGQRVRHFNTCAYRRARALRRAERKKGAPK